MQILFISDIVGRPGRALIKKVLPRVLEEFEPDLVIANAENLSHGNGFSPKNIADMQEVGIDFFTSGNHVWGNRQGAEMLDDKNFPVIRPANYPEGVKGRGYEIVKKGKYHVLVVNLLGRVFMKKDYDCPFREMDEILELHKDKKLDAIFVDFHAEVTSEKAALGFYLDGRVSAVIGTHTHVPTADLRILDKGTAFMTDAGMNGSLDSIIGVKKELIIDSFLTQLPAKFDPEPEGKMVFNAILLHLDDKSKKALNVRHVQKIL